MTDWTRVVTDYRARGWRVVPVHRPDRENRCTCGSAECPKPGKHPDPRCWPHGSDNPADFAGRNIGVKLGPDSGDLADVDLDCAEAVTVGFLLPATGGAFGRGGLVTHRLYFVPARDAAYAKLTDPVLSGERATIVELRWPEWDEAEKRFKHLQTVLPPSLHHSGEPLTWAGSGDIAVVGGDELGKAVRHVAAAVLVARYAKPKERHALVLLLANLLVRAGWDDARAVTFVTAVFAARNEQDMVARVAGAEGAGAVKDARKRLKNGKPMTGLPALAEMLDPALDHATATKVVSGVKDWLGIPDPPGPSVSSGTGPAPDWDPPVPLPEPDDAPPFPLDLFPKPVADFWAAAADALHVPVDYVACPALAVLGAAVGRSRAAEVKPGYAESPLFWVAVVAPPGSAKSAALGRARAPLDAAEARWRKDHADAAAAFAVEEARYEAELKEWKKAPDAADPPEKPCKPILRQSVLDDTTTEAARKVLRENPRGVVVLMDELIGFARQLNQYRQGGRGADKTFWLSGWNGRGLSKNNRAGTHDAGPLVVADPFTAVGGMLCPDSIGELREELRRGRAANDGWADRFLVSYPAPLPAVEESWVTVPEDLERGYAGVVDALLALDMVPIEDPARETASRPFFVRFDAGARAAWQAFTRDVAARINALPPGDAYRGVLSKLKHYAVRFAALFHCLDAACAGRAEDPVAEASVRRAVAVVWYFEAHGRRCLGVGSPETQAARVLLPAVAGWDGDHFSKRDLHRKVRGQSAFRRAGNLDAPLKELAAHGYVRSADGPTTAFGGRPSERFAINPLWDRGSGPPPSSGGGDSNPPGSPGRTGGAEPRGRSSDPEPSAASPAGVRDTGTGFWPWTKPLLAGVGRATRDAGIFSSSGGFVHIVHAPQGGPSNPSAAAGSAPAGRPTTVSENGTPVSDMDNMDKTPRTAGNLSVSAHMANAGQKGFCPRPKPLAATEAVVRAVPPGRVARVVTAIAATAGVGLDLETTGLNPARDRVRLISLATPAETFLIDLFAFDDPAAALAPLFEALATKEVVGHNVVAFDLPFLARLGFAPTRVFDTALASRVVHAGEALDHDLASVAHRHLGRTLDKAEQRSDWSRPDLTPTQLAYAAGDAAILLPLADALRAAAAERGVEPTLDLEMRCGVPVARMAATGVGFDTTAWLALADAAAGRRAALAAEMDALAPDPDRLPGAGGRNWDSTAGVRDAFAAVGVTLADTKEETLAGADHPLARRLLDYREAAKRTGTYGRAWAEKHVTSGRVFATWNPCQAKTGRMSCKAPNLQQVPRDPAYRRCFAARLGHVLVKCDYSQIELRIAAKVTGDTRMLTAYQAGEDLHTLTAAKFLGVGVDAVTKEARQTAKPVNFGAIYGLGPRSLRAKARADYGKDMTEREAKAFLGAFFAQYPGVRAWHDRLKRDTSGAVRTLGGRRVAVTADQFYGAKANYVVQGTGGDGLKRALVLLWERRAECPRAAVVLAVHDEVVVEVSEADAADARAWVARCMTDAMGPLVDPVPVEVETTVGKTWGG